MRRTTVAALAVTMAVITAVSAHSLHAQAAQQPDLHFDVTLAVPISVKAVHLGTSTPPVSTAICSRLVEPGAKASYGTTPEGTQSRT